MFRTILAAVDNSARAEGVVQAAAEVAEKFGGKVHLFRCLTVPPEFPAAARNAADDLDDVLRDQARAELVALAQGNPRLEIELPEVGTREPWRAILDAAARLGADLIVIGSHGFGGWDRILGTTAGRVANHADRPVLVIHQPQLEQH